MGCLRKHACNPSGKEDPVYCVCVFLNKVQCLSPRHLLAICFHLPSFHSSVFWNCLQMLTTSRAAFLKRWNLGCTAPHKEIWSMTPVGTIHLHWYPTIPRWSLKRDSLMMLKTECSFVLPGRWVGLQIQVAVPVCEVRCHIWGNIPSDPRVGHTDWC